MLLSPKGSHLDNSLYSDPHDAAVESVRRPNDHIEQQNAMRFLYLRSENIIKFHSEYYSNSYMALNDSA